MSGHAEEDRRMRLLRIRRTLLELRLPADQAPPAGTPLDPAAGAGPGACTRSALESLALNRRDFLRIRETLLGARFGGGRPEEEALAAGGRGQSGSREELVRLLLEIDRTCRRGARFVANKRLAIHAEIVRGSFFYVLAFLDADRASPEDVALSHFDISGSGVCFPTRVRHRAAERLFALLFLPVDPLPPLKLELEVVRPSRPFSPVAQAYLTAARFVNLDSETRARILAYVSVRQRERMLDRAYGAGGRTDGNRLRSGRLL